jgi:hypothetical protein
MKFFINSQVKKENGFHLSKLPSQATAIFFSSTLPSSEKTILHSQAKENRSSPERSIEKSLNLSNELLETQIENREIRNSRERSIGNNHLPVASGEKLTDLEKDQPKSKINSFGKGVAEVNDEFLGTKCENTNFSKQSINNNYDSDVRITIKDVLTFPLNDFNDFLLNNSPINLSPYNSDHEEDEELFIFSSNHSINEKEFALDCEGKLRDSPERSVGKDQFAVACEGKLEQLQKFVEWKEMEKLSKQSVENLYSMDQNVKEYPFNKFGEGIPESKSDFFEKNHINFLVDKFPSQDTANWSFPKLRYSDSLKWEKDYSEQSLEENKENETINSSISPCSNEYSFSSTEQSDENQQIFSQATEKPHKVSIKKNKNSFCEFATESKNKFIETKCKDIGTFHPVLQTSKDIKDFSETERRETPICRSLQRQTEISEMESKKNKKKRRFTKLTYENVENIVSKYYLQNKTSNQFDVLITYLQSKKNIYIQSKNLLQIYLTIINIFTLVLTASVAIFAPFMYNYNWSSYYISAVNSMIAILIKLKDGLKYESNIENYNKLANQFNNLETSMQLTSNKLQFIKEEDIKTKIIIEKIEYLDERLNDINNNFKMTFPEIIKKIFPIITHINIFTFIKKIETYKHFLIIDLQTVKNEIMFLTHKWNMNENIMSQINLSSSLLHSNEYFILPSQSTEQIEKEIQLPVFKENKHKLLFIKDKIRLQNLLKIKENIKIKLFHYKKIYEYIDEIFNEEIKNAESTSYWLYMIFFYKKDKNVKRDYDNPIVKELIKYAL